jgi:hypothetical protein
MTQTTEETMARRLELALELFEAGVAMVRCTLRRRHPGVSDEKIEKKVFEWLRERPGAIHGDTVGRLIPCPVEDPNE